MEVLTLVVLILVVLTLVVLTMALPMMESIKISMPKLSNFGLHKTC